MKFRYIGVSEFRDLDLVLNGIMTEKDFLIPDTIIEVPDTKRKLIKRLKVNGNFELVNEPSAPKKSKKRQNNRKNNKEDNING